MERSPLLGRQRGSLTKSTPRRVSGSANYGTAASATAMRTGTGTLPPKASDQLMASIHEFMAMCVFLLFYSPSFSN